MADINYRCPQCERIRTFSQYADPSGVLCPTCNVQYVRDNDAAGNAAAAPREKPALKLKRQRDPASASGQHDKTAPVAEANNAITLPTGDGQDDTESVPLHVHQAAKRKGISHAWIASLLFVVIGGLMGSMRYGNWLAPEPAFWLRAYGWVAVLIFHLIIVMKAMTDNIMQGLLTVLVPGYSLYYIFVVSDDFYLRAVFGGLLIGTGEDTIYYLNLRAQQMIAVVHQFIGEGGGSIR